MYRPSPLNVLFRDVIALISQGVPQLGASNNVEMAKTKISLHTHTRLSRAYLALARLSCYIFVFG